MTRLWDITWDGTGWTLGLKVRADSEPEAVQIATRLLRSGFGTMNSWQRCPMTVKIVEGGEQL